MKAFRNSDIKRLLKWPSIKDKELQEQSIQVFKIKKGMDKSKITRKQSKASKHEHENQKSTKPKPQSPKP
ncbi:hypothetical protein Tco_0148211 [Tanacetum coccineum]